MGEQCVGPAAPGDARHLDPRPVRLRAALSALDELEHRPVEQHPAAYDEVHRALQDALGAAPGGGAAPDGGTPDRDRATAGDAQRPPSDR